MKVLGIDPGLANTGWGVIELIKNRFFCSSYGVINTDKEQNNQDRVSFIADEIGKICNTYEVSEISIEDIFFAKNEVSAMNVAKVIGSVLYSAHLLGLKVYMYTPLQIKMSITGTGRAEKHQVQEMTRLLLSLDKIPRPDHSADALAAAVCHVNLHSTLSKLSLVKGGIKD